MTEEELSLLAESFLKGFNVAENQKTELLKWLIRKVLELEKEVAWQKDLRGLGL